jgi:DNA-binding MarR family transcriptional regulator
VPVPFSTVPSSPAATLGDELVRVTKLLHVAKSQAPRRHPQVDPMAYPLLFNLKRCPMRVSALAEAVHVDVSTVSRQVSTLVDLGLVERGPDPDDRRAQALSVTDEGNDLLLAIREGRERWLASLLSDWSDDDVRRFTDNLARFASDLECWLADPTPRTDR